MQRLRRTTELRRKRLDRRPQRGMILAVLQHHANRSITQLGRILGKSLLTLRRILNSKEETGIEGEFS
jgi:hypothetical protein